jgi:shikimate kinase
MKTRKDTKKQKGGLINRQNIILTGFMGTGKSTVGKILAERLGYGFVDTDELIVAQSGRTIAEIFEADGEAVFRQMEAAVAEQLAGERGLVIATGGGFMLNAANAEAMERSGQVFCLKAPAEEILRRLEADDNRRPLLAVANPFERIETLLAEREAEYGRFVGVENAGKTPGEIATQIIHLLPTV